MWQILGWGAFSPLPPTAYLWAAPERPILDRVKIGSCSQASEKVFTWTYLLKNNQLRQLVKFVISSTSRTHVRDFSGPVQWCPQKAAVIAQLKNVQERNYSAGFDDYCCIPECKSAFYCFLLFHVTGKESKLALVYLNFRKITAKIEDG